MKFKVKILSLILSICLIIVVSCGKKLSTSSNDTSTSTSTIEVVPRANHNVKKINLGIAESFAVLAYTSINSSPTSNIVGKVGLKPGIRSLISINPETEVVGGLSEVYAGDDIGDPSDYLNIARENLISGYRDATSRRSDDDKKEAYAGMPGGKILPPGIYQWSKGANILADVTLEGSASDIFIFQITGDLYIAPKVRIILSGGLVAKNIFWQVSGKVTLGSTSVTQGTIMSQLTFEMKNFAQLYGRALVKNGKLLLSQNVITSPTR
jgi:hypothetical protein